MQQSYWSKVLSRRVGRRRALVASGSFVASAAFIAACGGDDTPTAPGTTPAPGTEPTVGQPSLIAQPEDTSSQAKRGGTFMEYRSPEPREIDPHTIGGISSHSETTPQYSTLLKFEAGFGATPPTSTISGDAAESFEIAPDGRQVTVTLRQNHLFDPRPPTNGRAMTTEDVKWSYERTAELSATAGDFIYERAQAGPVESIQVPDDHTVIFNLAYPYGPITEMLAYWFLYVLPTEAESQFDPRRDARGSGPWRLENWDPDRDFNYVRNDDWYIKDRPYLDGIRRIILPEYASALAQFESKAIWNMNVVAEDILPVKNRHPEMVMLQDIRGGSPGQFTLHFGIGREDSQFRDVRLRRALSMLYDRGLFLNRFGNVDTYENAGLPVETFWDSQLASQALNWIDPRENSDLGEAQANFMYNPEEARRLIEAAGWDPEEEIEHRFRNVGATFPGHAEVLAAMFEEGGLKVRLVAETEAAWLDTKFSKGAGYRGLWGGTANSFNDDGFLFTKYTPGGRDTVSGEPLAGITDDIIRMRSEIDPERRSEMIKQIQIDLAHLMPDMSIVSTRPVLGYTLRWPWLKNHGVWSAQGFSEASSTARANLNFWYDPDLHT